VNCPLCQKPIPLGCVHFCPDCWWKRLNGKDRMQVVALARRRAPLGPKIDSIVKRLST
jgi:hypothetical protein